MANENKQAVAKLMGDVQSLADAGIRTDARQLKRDMVSQFPEPRLWIREYVVNSYDAAARTCHVSGREDDGSITIIVEDDGSGMDRETVQNWAYLFRSVKTPQEDLAQVGQFGVGKLSPAAMPQTGFLMVTSTGEECWRLNTGSLLDDSAIRVERITPVAPRGTRFEITFEKEHDLDEELKLLQETLERFVRYLPMATIVHRRIAEQASAGRPHVVRGEWGAHEHRCGNRYHFSLGDHDYEAVLGIGPSRSELYHRRVLVSDSYDLLNMGPDEIDVPHVVLRVDAPQLDLVLGRHRAADESVLKRLSNHLKNVIVPSYVTAIFDRYREGSLHDYGVEMCEAEDIAVAMMAWDSARTRPWSHMPVFAVLNDKVRRRWSLNQLVHAAQTKGTVYIAGPSAGTDFTVFDAPVVDVQQPTGALAVLQNTLGSRLANLAARDVAIEAPARVRPAFGEREKRFEAMLRFHPEALLRARKPSKRSSGAGRRGSGPLVADELERLMSVCAEAQQSRADLESISWRVGWLVQCDGQTPSRCHRYMLKDDRTVVINLNHPEMARLLCLSEKDPALAGHWALACCLCDDHASILPDLTSEAREDLLLLDCMAKVHMSSQDHQVSSSPVLPEASWLDFIRDADDQDFGLT